MMGASMQKVDETLRKRSIALNNCAKDTVRRGKDTFVLTFNVETLT